MKRLNLNLFDASALVIVLLSVIGFGLARKGYAGVDQVIEGVHKVGIDVYIIGLKTLDTDIFKEGDPCAISIRNRPVEPPMKITHVEHYPHLQSFLAPDGKSARAFPDPANPVAHDYVVTLVDEAEQTKDGYVIRGNKVKIGNLVELEGFKYRVQGVVVDVHPSSQATPSTRPGSDFGANWQGGSPDSKGSKGSSSQQQHIKGSATATARPAGEKGDKK